MINLNVTFVVLFVSLSLHFFFCAFLGGVFMNIPKLKLLRHFSELFKFKLEYVWETP
ncbi:hypothetical protein PCIT_b1115 [Pseudoalteromonas citrea]|uniref:Uncharacterized protein n=1 Tax=Pseudoalteromonas citrea TaxID=43655 RepID=A0AAD4AFI4_9GAMM|nr:hypothetical protein PCIT_b1115 [Pseudoalteromonas citrea]